MAAINNKQEEMTMKMLLMGIFGFLLAIFGISVINQPLEALTLIMLFSVGLNYDKFVATFTQEK